MSNILATAEKVVRHEFDLRFTIVAEPRECDVVYKIYNISSYEGKGENPSWPRIDAQSCMDETENLDEAEVYLSGYVKWDGCSNWLFDEQERCMLHGCTRGDVLRFGEVMALCWDWAAELCPNWWPGS